MFTNVVWYRWTASQYLDASDPEVIGVRSKISGLAWGVQKDVYEEHFALIHIKGFVRKLGEGLEQNDNIWSWHDGSYSHFFVLRHFERKFAQPIITDPSLTWKILALTDGLRSEALSRAWYCQMRAIFYHRQDLYGSFDKMPRTFCWRINANTPSMVYNCTKWLEKTYQKHISWCIWCFHRRAGDGGRSNCKLQ